MRKRRSQPQKAFTVIELLVVMFIIAIMAGLTLSAVQNARESGRRTTCQNNLRNQALASLSVLESHNHFPSGGWGGWWVGIPGRGTGKNQPGGWVFILLPHVERGDLIERGQSLPAAELPDYLARVIQVPQALFNCPSRRQAGTYAIFYDYAAQPRGASAVSQVARSDYAANAGDQSRSEFQGWWGPQTLAEGDNSKFGWPDTSAHSGVSFLRSEIAAAQLRDGLSRTYLVAEKYLSAKHYDSGADHGDDWSMYTGYQDDVYRTTYDPPWRDGEHELPYRFGSNHAAGFNAAFCDGHVKLVRFDIDRRVHRSLGHRADGEVFGDDEF